MPERTVKADWVLQQVGRDPRVLRLVYSAGGCLLEDGEAVVHETDGRIRIRVEQTERYGPNAGCQYIETFPHLKVKLRRPVAGRPILGEGNIGGILSGVGERRRRGSDGLIVPIVPRVLGLARKDAVRLLNRQRFRVRILSAESAQTRGSVTEQLPRAGGLPKGDREPFGPVTLTLGSPQN